MPFYSIDQNCTPLWDALPKVRSLAAAGHGVVHFVEDVDVAFTRRGAKPGGAPEPLRLEREACYPDGGSDWGAALFYPRFLGRSPLDLSALEPFIGLTPAAAARRLGMDVNALFAAYSVSDFIQAVGPSHAGGGLHRVIGGVRASEAAPCVMALMDAAAADLAESFPEEPAKGRAARWAAGERARAAGILSRCGDGAPLSEFYMRWMADKLPPPAPEIRQASDLFALAPGGATMRLLSLFLDDYQGLAALYNAAVDDAGGGGPRKLRASQGDLPFFAVFRLPGGVMARAPLRLDAPRMVSCAGRAWPAPGGRLDLSALAADGVCALCPKALLLVLDARLRPDCQGLAMPVQGSLYMPAARALERRLADAGLLWTAPAPVVRLDFRMFDRWASARVRVRLPPYLWRRLGSELAWASDLAEALPAAAAAARAELESLRSPEGRAALRRRLFPEREAERAALEARRQRLARAPATQPEASELFRAVSAIENAMLPSFLDRVVEEWHVAGVGHWSHRGAVEPWAVAMGGEELLAETLGRAVLSHE